jgi:hypothetical protein
MFNWWDWWDLAWMAPSYAGAGLLTSRQIRFGMQKSADELNAQRQEKLDAWKEKHQGNECSIRFSGGDYYCANCGGYRFRTPIDNPGLRDRAFNSGWYEKQWFGGAFWPVVIPGYAAYRVARVVYRSVKPGWDWFMESPTRRKSRRAV